MKLSFSILGLILLLVHCCLYASNLCVTKASHAFSVPQAAIQLILEQEAGQTGKVSQNSNKTLDIGPMQINSIWLPQLEQLGISQEQLKNDYCTNVFVGTWILRQNINAADGDLIKGMGWYHSRTPKLYKEYLTALAK